MLTGLSIRDIVLIDRLDLAFGPGLTVLTGETGAGKSILLDALGLALGARGDSGLVRAGAERGVVTAAFAPPAGHPVFRLLHEQGIEASGEVVLRRLQQAEGASRGFINDQPASVGLMRQAGALLAEIHGQHDERALIDAAQHRRLVDAFGGLVAEVAAVGRAWEELTAARRRLAAFRDRAERAAEEREFLRHALAELASLDPEVGEETRLAEERQLMMHAEAFAEAIGEAADALSGDGAVDGRLNAALRRLERRRGEAGGRLDAVCSALERVLLEMGEAAAALEEARRALEFDPRRLEATEERLFALRALARKHRVTVDELPALKERFAAEAEAVEDASRHLAGLEREAAERLAAYRQASAALTAARAQAADDLDRRVMAELPALKLDRVRFRTVIETAERLDGPTGSDAVEFRVAANPGTPLGSLAKVASGGELSRLMLALKVVLAARGSAPTLVFDEVDAGVGGATADAVGARLSRLAGELQVLAVTHSPQVAARADRHLLIAKIAEVGAVSERAVTRVSELAPEGRREEIARMLSGERVTAEARAQATRLIEGTG
jgi:DNA repair protein RecN (Recombination protein N)